MTLFAKFVKHNELKARGEIIKYLSMMPDDQLRSLGYSPKLLSQGVHAWPWKEASEKPVIADLLAANDTSLPQGVTASESANRVAA
jgi:Golgi nucleoside diphosphatase